MQITVATVNMTQTCCAIPQPESVEISVQRALQLTAADALPHPSRACDVCGCSPAPFVEHFFS
jgi:hypothetical protein